MLGAVCGWGLVAFGVREVVLLIPWSWTDPFPVCSGDPGRHSRDHPLPAGQHPLHLWQVPWAGFRCKLMLGVWLGIAFQCAHLIPWELG